MFLGLLNRVKKDLVRTHLHCIIRSPTNEWTTKDNGGDRPSFCASLIQNSDRDLSDIEMSFLAGAL